MFGSEFKLLINVKPALVSKILSPQSLCLFLSFKQSAKIMFQLIKISTII